MTPAPRCPKCGSRAAATIRTARTRLYVRRRRECVRCGARITTFEGTPADLRRVLCR